MRLTAMVPWSRTFHFCLPYQVLRLTSPHPPKPHKICQLPSVEGTIATPCLSTTDLRNREEECGQATGGGGQSEDQEASNPGRKKKHIYEVT